MIETQLKEELVNGIKVYKTFTAISNLIPNPSNPRDISEEKLNDLIFFLRENQSLKPLLVDARPDHEGEVLGGNMRLKALKQLEVTEVWVELRVPTDDAHAFEIATIDNMEFGFYLEDKLMAQLKLYQQDIDMTRLGVNIGEIPTFEQLLESFSNEDIKEDEVPAVSKEPALSEYGKVYQLGRHRLMCGDATKIEDVEKLMDGQRADMVFTDPPYGMDYSGRGENTSNKIMGDNIDPTEFYNIGAEIPERYIWGRVENYKNLLIEPRDVIIWRKNNFGMGAGYRGQYECCFYYGSFNGSDSDVWDTAKDANYEHPTQKPVALAVRAIKNSQPTTVIDYFGGSGSTLIACEQTNRTCYMMELDPKYCDVIRKRYAKIVNKENEWETVTPAIAEVEPIATL